MNQGRYNDALPILQQAVQKLDGTGDINEAYADYNLAYTMIQLGSCPGALALLDESERIQGYRSEIVHARKQARKC
jgi:hypothetical protein